MFEFFYDPINAKRLILEDNVHPALVPIPNNCYSNEEFRYITDYMVPDICPYYLVSNLGRVYDLERESFLSGTVDKDGYIRLSIRTKTSGSLKIGTHRLVLLAFDYRPGIETDKNMVPNHKDGITNHNNLDNLEWTTQKGNAQHAIQTGLHKMHGSDNPNNKLSEKDVHEICKLIESGKYFDTEIAKMYNVSYTNISDIHKGKIWSQISNKYNMNIRKHKALSPEDVHKICKLLQDSELNEHEIAKKFNITNTNISDIRKGNIWKDISSQYDIDPNRNMGYKKYPPSKIREVCELLQNTNKSISEISKIADVGSATVGKICRKESFKDIVKEYNFDKRH